MSTDRGWRAAQAFALLLLAAGCESASRTGTTPWEWELPAGFPPPDPPATLNLTVESVELGRHLFYDPRLSGNATLACSGCHEQSLAFAQNLTVAVGSTGELTRRNSQSLGNAVYASTLTWAHPSLDALADQALIPMFGTDPVEMGITGNEAVVLDRLAGEPIYQELFSAAYPDRADPIAYPEVANALAAFVSTLVTGDSAFDRWTYQGDVNALSASQLRGMSMFFGEELECHHCHAGFNFAIATSHEGSSTPAQPFNNTGLYNVDGEGSYPASDQGLAEFTGLAGDRGKFRAPSLRNVALTAPYAHDGSVATLDDVIDNYAAGGRVIQAGLPNAGDGTQNPNKSVFVHGFPLTQDERADLLAFLNALTDEGFLVDERFASPWQ